MINVKIYKPTATATQSGHLKTRWWVMECEKVTFSRKESLMHWNSAADTQQQIILRFSTLEKAVHYAQQQGFSYRIIKPEKEPSLRLRPYSTNFIRKSFTIHK